MTESSSPLQTATPNANLVPVQHRHNGWTPARQVGFLETLADTCNVREAAASVGMTETSAYRLRRRADAAGFDAAWTAAVERGLERLTAIAIDRAVTGTVKRTYYHGELVDEQVVHSERMMMFLLEKGRSALDRAKVRQKGALDGASSDWDSAMAALERPRLPGEPEDRYRVWCDEYGTRVTNFPPPPDFDGYEEGRPGAPGYLRTLDEAEDAAQDKREAEAQHVGEAARAEWFGEAG